MTSFNLAVFEEQIIYLLSFKRRSPPLNWKGKSANKLVQQSRQTEVWDWKGC